MQDRWGMLAAAYIGCAIGLLAMGLVTLGFADLLLQWQPAPPDAAWRRPLAYVSGLILLAAGIGLCIPRTRRWAALLGALWFGCWTLFLHLPATIASGGILGVLLGLAEIAAMGLGLGALALWASTRGRRLLVAAYGACLLVFGASHFVYADITASMVPSWLPARLFLAYLTGAIHALMGLFLLAGVFVRIAAAVEALMMLSFVILLHLPRLAGAPSDRFELTMTAIATMLTAATWAIAATARRASGAEAELSGNPSGEPGSPPLAA